MKPIGMSPRRWFWALCLAALVWLVVASRMPRAAGENVRPSALEMWAGTAVRTVLTPASAVFTWGQSGLQKFTRPPLSAGNTPQVRELQRKNNELLQQQVMLLARIETLEKALSEIQKMQRFASLDLQNVISANVTGISSSSTVQTCTIDQGEAAGVKPGGLVYAQLAPVGRVMATGRNVATVRLITDRARSMWMNTRIIRQNQVGGYQVIVENCQVRGTGEGTLVCDSVAVTGPIAPEVGDVVQLWDNDWGPLRGAGVGRITKVARAENQHLRYSLAIQPEVTVSEASSVWVVK